MIEAMSQTVADVIGRIGIISIWKTHPRRSTINEKSPILTTSENQAYILISEKQKICTREDRLNIKTQLIIGALKLAEFLDHISMTMLTLKVQ